MSPAAGNPAPYASLDAAGATAAAAAAAAAPGRRAHVRRCLCVRRSSCLLAAYTVLYVLYVAMGAYVFSYLEQPEEEMLKRRLQTDITQFLGSYRCVTDAALERLITEVVVANNRGVSAAANVSSSPNWSFGQSFFFSATVVTTIGYGHVTPLSEAGKLFCIVFALAGIPLTLVILSAYVERLMVPSTAALQWLCGRLNADRSPLCVRLLHLSVVGVLVLGLFLLVPAAAFARLEHDWTFLDSLYYCFISLTTVGLGDYIPGDQAGQRYRPLYKMAITAYLLAGLVMMMWLLTVFAEIPQLNIGALFLPRSDEATGDPEKIRLASATPTPGYSKQADDVDTISNRTVLSTASSTPTQPRQ